MVFVERFKLLRKEPELTGRFYLHSAGLEEVFGTNINARDYLSECIDNHLAAFSLYSYVLGTVWGDLQSGDKLVDVFGFMLKNWSDNPDVYPWIVKNGVYTPQGNILKYCGDTLILLGEEEKFRRTRKSLEEYMFYDPDLGGLFQGSSSCFLL